MVSPAVKRSIVKKKTNSFPRFHSDRWGKVAASWRMPKGIDSRVRRKFKGNLLLPQVGYGSDKQTKNMLPSGFYKFQVHNVEDLEMLKMQNTKYAAEIAHGVSTPNKMKIVKRAAELDIRVVNKPARIVAAESQ